MAPFQYDTYRNAQAGSIAELMARRGDIAAKRAESIGQIQGRAAEQSGNAWVGAIGNIGQTVAAIPGQLQQQKQQAQQDEMRQIQVNEAKQRRDDMVALDKALSTPGGRDAVLESTPGHLRPAIMKQYQEADELALKSNKAAEEAAKLRAEHFGFLGAQIKHADYSSGAALAAIHQARESYANDPEMLKKIDAMRMQVIEQPESIKQMADGAILGSSYKDMLKPKTLINRDPTHDLVDPETQKVVLPGTPKAEKAPAPPNVGSFEDYVTRKYGPQPTPPQIEQARKAYGDAGRMTVQVGGNGGDVKEAVAGMMDGTIPPMLPGRASKEYVATMAEAHRQGYDLQGAVTDWNATQKHIATMNGAQQLRLTQAINSLPEMLDSVDSLASKWKGGQFPILNKANLAAAKAGAYGRDVASVANQLDAQIADVTADLGVVYMGGNSPTDHALGLAGKSLSGSWDEKVLHDMVKLAKKNVGIRSNSVKNTGVSGASANNPYAPKTSEPVKVGGFTVVVRP